MGHLLATVNPEAARQIDDRRPLPRIGQSVVYHPRPNEIRQGRTEIPAIVTKVDEGNRRLELVVIFEAADMITQPNVPQHVEGDRGWSYLPEGNTDALEAKISALEEKVNLLMRAVAGEYEMPAKSVLELLDAADERIGTLEDAIATKMPINARAAAEAEHQPRRRLRGNRA